MKKRNQTLLYKRIVAALKALDPELSVHDRSRLAYAILARGIAYTNGVMVSFLQDREIP